jgi:acyl-homoserine lactone acylase PvdQ
MTRLTARLVRLSRLSVLLCALLLLASCKAAPGPAPDTGKVAATGTEILWDRYGVPHIFAPDHASLFQAYGYAQMEAHSELLVRLYAQARGRGAEFYGAQYLDSDKWVRTNGDGQAVGGGADAGVRRAHPGVRQGPESVGHRTRR